MVEIAGLTETGRQLKDPAATLVELENDDGLRHTSIVFDDPLARHEALTLNVELVRSFMEYPMVKGLVEMSHCDLEQSTFTYPTGNVWTLTEVLRIYRDVGQIVGVRAALELCYLCAEILKEAGETGPVQGCFSHGNLTPSRIAIRGDGHVQIFGYGLAQVEVIKHLNEGYVVSSESLRYAPPERLEGQPEDTSADTYALTVIAWEMMTGKPLYNTHNVDNLKRMITMSEGSTMLAKSKEKGIPKEVLQTMARALIYDPDTRLSGEEYMEEIERLLDMAKVKGSSLVDMMDRARGTGTKKAAKGRKLTSKADTSLFTPAELAAIADEEDEEEEAVETRWGKAKRRRAQKEEEAPAPSRRRRRSADAEPEEEAKPRRRRRTAEAKSEQPAEEEAKPRRRRRTAEPEEKAEAKTQEEPEEEPKPRRRRRRTAEPEEKAEAKTPEEPEEESKPKRRRRRTAEPEEKAEAKAEAEEAAPPRRRRRKAESEEQEVEAKKDEDEPPKRRRRRRSTPTAEDSEEPKKPTRRRRRNPK